MKIDSRDALDKDEYLDLLIKENADRVICGNVADDAENEGNERSTVKMCLRHGVPVLAGQKICVNAKMSEYCRVVTAEEALKEVSK